jgi:alkanesulfonate monooxygenase SsuD/methylene tetrahydromethanopterin reductase-like flavin-dependent oxidoreductase (luciferase family)
MRDEDLNVETIVDQLVIWGTPESVTDQILAYREEIGDFGTLLYAGHDWMDKRLARRSMELMATRVMPEVNKAIGRASVAAQ